MWAGRGSFPRGETKITQDITTFTSSAARSWIHFCLTTSYVNVSTGVLVQMLIPDISCSEYPAALEGKDLSTDVQSLVLRGWWPNEGSWGEEQTQTLEVKCWSQAERYADYQGNGSKKSSFHNVWWKKRLNDTEKCCTQRRSSIRTLRNTGTFTLNRIKIL